MKYLMLVLFGFLMALGFAELAVRVLFPHPRYPEFMVPDMNTGNIQKPGSRCRATNMFGEYDTFIEINSEGFRDKDYIVDKKQCAYRIAFLGDSFTFAEQVDECNCFVRIVETLLNRSMKKTKVECMNFGIGGWDTYQEVLCYEYYIKKYHPDLVVLVMYPQNDVPGNVFYKNDLRSARPHFRLIEGKLSKIPGNREQMEISYKDNARRFTNVSWYQYSHLYNKFRIFMWKIRQICKNSKISKQIHEQGEDFIKSNTIWELPIHGQYRYYSGDGMDSWTLEADMVTYLLLGKLSEMVGADGAKLCVVLLPSFENLWPEKWPERIKSMPGMEMCEMSFSRPFDRLSSCFSKLNIPFLDLRAALRKVDSEKSIFFKMDAHYNRRGQQAVGDEIFKWLVNDIDMVAPQ
ncbi:MAG: SGNH/GDSL hydrolase family protein [Verrucomicrobiae bacterium]|nr:SGNH/GDSL hydrolase family protein [Verrucomicrobiae bacterium]